MDRLEVDYGSGATEIEQILASAKVARAAALLPADLSEAVFDRDVLTQSGAPLGGLASFR